MGTVAHIVYAAVALSSITAAVAGHVALPASLERQPSVGFRDDLVCVRQFDPCSVTPRFDIDVARWSSGAGHWPKSQTLKESNASRAAEGVICGFIDGHLACGCPSPPELIELSEAIALRNAWELAESLGRRVIDKVAWPKTDKFQLLPRPGHDLIEDDPQIHIDEFPTQGCFEAVPIGAHIVLKPS